MAQLPLSEVRWSRSCRSGRDRRGDRRVGRQLRACARGVEEEGRSRRIQSSSAWSLGSAVGGKGRRGRDRTRSNFFSTTIRLQLPPIGRRKAVASLARLLRHAGPHVGFLLAEAEYVPELIGEKGKCYARAERPVSSRVPSLAGRPHVSSLRSGGEMRAGSQAFGTGGEGGFCAAAVVASFQRPANQVAHRCRVPGQERGPGGRGRVVRCGVLER